MPAPLLLMLGFVALVAVLTYLSRRTGTSGGGCCAPVDPVLDKRMRDAFE